MPICKKCLLEEQNVKKQGNTQNEIDRLLAAMPSGEKADDELIRHRKEICRNCDKLSEDTCLACGCFIRIRTAGKKMRCPQKKW